MLSIEVRMLCRKVCVKCEWLGGGGGVGLCGYTPPSSSSPTPMPGLFISIPDPSCHDAVEGDVAVGVEIGVDSAGGRRPCWSCRS